MKFCQQCGAEIGDNVKFCMKCGAKISEPVRPEPVQPVQPVQPEQPVQTAEQKAEDLKPLSAAEKPKKKGGKKILIIAVACLLVAATVVGVLLIFRRKGRNEKADDYRLDFITYYRESEKELYIINKSGKIDKISDIGYDIYGDPYYYKSDDSGKKAVFSVKTGGEYVLYYYDGELKRITNDYSYIIDYKYNYSYKISNDGSTVVFVRDDEVYSYKGGKTTKLVSNIDSFIDASPDCNTIAYSRNEYGYYYTGGKEYELGKNMMTYYISNGGKIVILEKNSGSESIYYVQKGSDDGTRIKLRNCEGWYYIDVIKNDLSEISYSGNNGTYLWKDGMDSPEKISSKELNPYYISNNGSSKYFYNYDYGFYVLKDGTAERVLKSDGYMPIIGDRVYYKEDGSLKYKKLNGLDGDPVTLIKYDVDDFGFINDNTFLIWTTDGEVRAVKENGQSQYIAEESDFKQYIYLDNKLFYLSDGELYKTDGGKPEKVKGVTGEIKSITYHDWISYRASNVAVIVTDDGVYYTTDYFNSFNLLYKD